MAVDDHPQPSDLPGLQVQASFEQRGQLVELLIDRVVVTDGQVEIRHVIPTTPGSTKTRFVTCGQTISAHKASRKPRMATTSGLEAGTTCTWTG